MKISEDEIEFCKRLIREFPELGECVDEYNMDNGEFLPYLFLADVTQKEMDHEQTDIEIISAA